MILLRHGQSAFNLHFTRTRRDPGLVDPELTPLGLQQAQDAARTLCDASPTGRRIGRIIVSPYRRALQTAEPVARRLGLAVEVRRLVRERYAFSCDIGSPRDTLERDWPSLDFRDADGCWWHDGSLDPDGRPAHETEEQVIARADAFRAEMARDEAADPACEILLVAHWGFLLALGGRSLENGGWSVLDPSLPLPGPIVWRH